MRAPLLRRGVLCRCLVGPVWSHLRPIGTCPRCSATVEGSTSGVHRRDVRTVPHEAGEVRHPSIRSSPKRPIAHLERRRLSGSGVSRRTARAASRRRGSLDGDVLRSPPDRATYRGTRSSAIPAGTECGRGRLPDPRSWRDIATNRPSGHPTRCRRAGAAVRGASRRSGDPIFSGGRLRKAPTPDSRYRVRPHRVRYGCAGCRRPVAICAERCARCDRDTRFLRRRCAALRVFCAW
jgi:hypothetical protein